MLSIRFRFYFRILKDLWQYTKSVRLQKLNDVWCTLPPFVLLQEVPLLQYLTPIHFTVYFKATFFDHKLFWRNSGACSSPIRWVARLLIRAIWSVRPFLWQSPFCILPIMLFPPISGNVLALPYHLRHLSVTCDVGYQWTTGKWAVSSFWRILICFRKCVFSGVATAISTHTSGWSRAPECRQNCSGIAYSSHSALGDRAIFVKSFPEYSPLAGVSF